MENNYENFGGYYSPYSWEEFTLQDEKRARGRFSRFFLAVFLYMLTSVVVIFGIELALKLSLGDGATKILESTWFVWAVNVLAMYVIAFPLLYLLLRKMRSVPRAKSKMRVGEFLTYFAMGQALMTVGNLVGNYLNAVIGAFLNKEISNSTAELIENSPIWLIFLVAVVIGPIVEELIFRKLLMDKLGMYGDRIAIFVSAIAFGIFHGNFYQLFYAVLLGFLLAYIYSQTSNILYPILIHVLINFFGSVLPMPLIKHMDRYLELSELALSGGAYDQNEFMRLSLMIGGYSFMQLAICALGVYFLFKNRRRFFVSDRCELLIPKNRRASVIIKNPGAILYIILMSLIMISSIFT